MIVNDIHKVITQEVYNLLDSKNIGDSVTISTDVPLIKISEEDDMLNVEATEDNVKRYFWVKKSDVARVDTQLCEMTKKQLKERKQNIKEIKLK